MARSASLRARSVGLRLAFAGIIAVAAFTLVMGSGVRGSAEAPQPFLKEQPIVVLADREVCSLLTDEKMAVGITGQDSGGVADVGGITYWTFGDTLMSSGGLFPNALASSLDRDASDCLELTPNTRAGSLVPLLNRAAGETAVWPAGMEATDSDLLHFFYASVIPTSSFWTIQGLGLGSLDIRSVLAQRALDGDLLWRQDGALPAWNVRTFADSKFVYIFLGVGDPLATDTILARVPKASVEEPATYDYWQPASHAGPGHWVAGLWDANADSWSAAIGDIAPLWTQAGGHNGVEVAYNSFIDRWVAVYTTAGVTSLRARTAPEITGPWDEDEVELVACPDFHPAPNRLFVCYSGKQHEYFSRDGGRTIYVTYSNSDEYATFLHEIRLGSPIYQWSNAAGNAEYITGEDASSPDVTPDGIVFYASDIPVPGFSEIHRWVDEITGAIRLGATAPADGRTYSDGGIVFYAPLDKETARATNALYSPVYQWAKGDQIRYSALNLAPSGYRAEELAFYAACPDTDIDRKTVCTESFSFEQNADPDGDGLQAQFEEETPGCDPVIFNDDQDGLAPIWEVISGATNPCIWDSGHWGCDNAPLRDPLCDEDADKDRCQDAWELGPNPRLGGKRDPQYPWDYFNPTRDGLNRTDDIVAVVRNYYANGSSPGYSTDLDRGGRNGPNPWNLAPPDGRVLIDDIVAAVGSYLNDCR